MAAFKKYYIIRVVLTAVFGFAVGALFLLAEPYADEIFDVLLIAMGLLTVVMNLPALFLSLIHVRRKGEWISLLTAAVAVAFGVVVTLIQRDVLLLVLGVYSVVFPAVRIFLVANRQKQFKREVPNMLFGLFMVFVSLAEIEELVFRVCGIAVLSGTGLYLLWSLLTMKLRFAAFDAYVRELMPVPAETQNEQNV